MYFLSLEFKVGFPFNSKLIPKVLGEKIWYPGKKYPDPDRTEILIPDLTRKYFLKRFPIPEQETQGYELPCRSLTPISW